jgi:hypothetical protein
MNMAALRPLFFSLVSLVVLGLGVLSPVSDYASDQSSEAAIHPVQIVMKNVMYHYTEPVAVHIFRLQGELLPVKAGAIVVFDDKNSFILNLASAEIAISCQTLAQVLNEDVLDGADAPIKGVSIESRNNQLIIRGKFHQKGDVAFETTGTLSANGDGRIRLHSEHVKAAHLPLKGLMDLLGLDLAGMINTKKIRGLAVEKDDLLIDPREILPAPKIQGKVTAVRLQGNDIVQTFGSPQPADFAAKQAGNYIAFRDGNVRFGKLTMFGSDLIMTDIDQRDPFDFFLDHYREQLAAGYSKSTLDLGLRAHVVDYNKLHRRAVATGKGSSSLPSGSGPKAQD